MIIIACRFLTYAFSCLGGLDPLIRRRGGIRDENPADRDLDLGFVPGGKVRLPLAKPIPRHIDKLEFDYLETI